MELIGHRGAKGLAPENTIAAFKAGIAAGVDWVEFDVRATADGHVVVLHDGHTLRVARKLHVVSRTPYKSLQQLNVPTLAEAFAAIANKAKINIEVKTDGCAQAVAEQILRSVRKGAKYTDFLVSSFHLEHLAAVHRVNPRIRLGMLHLINPYMFLKVRDLRLHAVGFHWRTVTSSAIKQAKQRGMMVYVYTVDDAKRAAALATRGVDAIVTNRPDVLAALKHK